jgi:hypothetical protein
MATTDCVNIATLRDSNVVSNIKALGSRDGYAGSYSDILAKM